MKKTAIAFLCLLFLFFLLSGCAALPEGDTASGLGVGEMVTTVDGRTVLDLTGVRIMLEAGRDGDTRGARAYAATGEHIYAEAVLAVDADRAVLRLSQAIGGEQSVYMTSDAEIVDSLNKLMDALSDGSVPGLATGDQAETEGMTEKKTTITMDILTDADQTADWLDVDLTDATDLSGMEGEQASDVMAGALSDFLSAALSSLSGRAASNKLMSFLPW